MRGTYRVQWFGSYRSGRLSDMPDKALPFERTSISPVLDARRQRCHLRCIVARPPAHVSVGLQHMFAMFGATVARARAWLFPFRRCFCSPASGTLLFHFLSRGKVPAFWAHRLPLLPVMPPSRPTVKPSFCLTLVWALPAPVCSIRCSRRSSVRLVPSASVFFPPMVTGPIVISMVRSWQGSYCQLPDQLACRRYRCGHYHQQHLGRGMVPFICRLLGVVVSYAVAGGAGRG